MDPNRFDRLSKSVATRITRRGVLAGLGGGGLVAALGDSSSVAATGKVTCVYDFDGTVDIGPSSNLGATSEVTGELTITVGADGAIDSGKLVQQDGTTWPVVGQAIGRAINLRFSVPKIGAFIAVGTGRNNIAACPAAMAGPASGPQRKDFGSWTATLKSGGGTTPTTPVPVAGSNETQTSSDGGSSGAPTEPSGNVPSVEPTTAPTETPTAVPTSDCQLACGTDTLGVDLDACTCLCGSGTIFCDGPQRAVSYVGHCNDLLTDASHCGVCGHACTGNETCVDGVCGCTLDCGPGNSVSGSCQCVCGSGLTSCLGGYCADIVRDNKNCGACGIVCPAFAGVCSSGTCTAEATS